ncbi:MAG: hypothetical protein ACREII_03215, partial [Nitrospiraceae bacterium]
IGAMPALAEEKDLEGRVKQLEEKLQQFQEHEKREREREREPGALPAGPPPGGTGPITGIKVERAGEEKVPLGFSSTGSGRLIYAKPFLAVPKSTIGGYADIKYGSLTGTTLDNPSRNTFNQERMVPFIYADITDRLKFATEIEFERGGTNSPGTTVNGTPGGTTASGSMQLEFAQIDYLLTEAINLRAGILLMPVGKFNLLHDSPLNDLPDRPMVDRLVIPSTWFESGAGIYGTLYPTALSKLDYELYAVNGTGCNAQGASITDTSGMRNCRGSVSRDNNDNKGVVGRVAFSPRLGIEVAGSAYYGQYSNRDATGNNNQNNNIGIYAIDWTLQRGPWEVIGEAAWSRITGNQGTTITTQGPDGMFGYYIQANYHFMPEFLKRWAPGHFSDASTFTAVVRWETVDTDTGNKTMTATGALSNQRDLQRLTLGLNFRPIEDTVLKLSYLFNTQKDTSIQTMVNNPTNSLTTRVDGNGFLAMLATYF